MGLIKILDANHGTRSRVRALALLQVPHELAAEGAELSQLFIHSGHAGAQPFGDAPAFPWGARSSQTEERER
jgi:hypothetical protein